MELFDVVVVAETVGPPAGDEVETASRHGLEEVVAAVGGTGKFCGFLGSGAGLGGGVFGWGRDLGDCAEVGSRIQDHAFVRFGWKVCVGRKVRGVGILPPLGEFGGWRRGVGGILGRGRDGLGGCRGARSCKR